MAYISTEQVKEMRDTLKALFPKNFKFSVKRSNYSGVSVALMQSPLEFDPKCNINTYHLNKAPHKTIMRIIKDVINKDNFDHSDSMTDYFNVGHYIDIEIGRWDKPYIKK